jgi:hypothetical protein
MAGRDRALIVVVEHGGPTMFARIGVLRALNRHHIRDFHRFDCGSVPYWKSCHWLRI